MTAWVPNQEEGSTSHSDEMRAAPSGFGTFTSSFKRNGGTSEASLSAPSLLLPPLRALPAEAHEGLVAKLAVVVGAPLTNGKVKALVEDHVPAYAAALAKGDASRVVSQVRSGLSALRLSAALKKHGGGEMRTLLETSEHTQGILDMYASAYDRLDDVDKRRDFETGVVLPHLQRADLEHALIRAGGAQAQSYANMIHERIDLDEVDQYEAVLAEHGPAYLAAKHARNLELMDAHERLAAERLQCPGHKHGQKQQKKGESMAARLPYSHRPKAKRPSPKKKYASPKLDALIASASLDDRAMLEEIASDHPQYMAAFVESGVSLASISDWWRRNFGTKKQKQKQAAKDAQKRQRDLEDAQNKLNRAKDRDARKNGPRTESALQAHYDEETITAEMEDNGPDDPFAEDAEFMRDRDRLAADLDEAARLERNIFKSIKDKGREVIRSIGSKPKPEMLNAFAPGDVPPPEEQALLSYIQTKGFGATFQRTAMTVVTQGRAEITVIKREPKAEVIASDKAVGIATYVPNRKGPLSFLSGTKILLVDVRPLYEKDFTVTHLFGANGYEQLEIMLPLKSNEAEGIMAVQPGKTGDLAIHLRMVARVEGAQLYYTLEKRPLTVLYFDERMRGDPALSYILLVVPAAGLAATDIMKEPAPGAVSSGVADLARWISLGARTPSAAEEELRALSLVPVTDARAQAHVNHVLEEALRQHFMQAVNYKPTVGAYPIKTVLEARTSAPSPSTPSALLNTAVNTLATKGAASAAALGALLVTELKSTTRIESDPATLRTVTSLLSLLLCANGSRITGLADAANRLANLWNPTYNRHTASYFAFDQ